MKKTVILVSCVASKADKPMQAQYLYNSAWFNKASRFARRFGSKWYILSAQHSLLAPEVVIAPYDKTLRRMSWKNRESWAEGVLRQIAISHHPDEHRFVILAGKLYRQYLEPKLKEKGYEVSVPLEGLGIGQQLRWLDAPNIIYFNPLTHEMNFFRQRSEDLVYHRQPPD
jgi:hypothetical protein